MSTNVLSIKDIKREKHVIDASGQILGRLATQVAKLLQGKHKPNYVPYLDCGDFVTVINAGKIKVTGKKMQDKKYVRHSGYPGGLKEEILEKILIQRPEYVMEHAIWGMMPKGRLGKQMIKKLKVYKETQ